MAKRPTTQPRKIPKQSRARATVAAIVEAAARILEERGFDAMNVNQVAELAGVSIGSLYQYFPSKLALVGAVASELGKDAALAFGEGLAEIAKLPLDEAIEVVVARVFAIYRIRPELRRLIAESVPEAVPHFDTPEVDARARELLVAYLSQAQLRVVADRVPVAVDVLMSAVQAIARESITATDREARLEETTAMVRRYLLA